MRCGAFWLDSVKMWVQSRIRSLWVVIGPVRIANDFGSGHACQIRLKVLGHMSLVGCKFTHATCLIASRIQIAMTVFSPYSTKTGRCGEEDSQRDAGT